MRNCTTCKGSGYFTEQPDTECEATVACPDCDGTGKIVSDEERIAALEDRVKVLEGALEAAVDAIEQITVHKRVSLYGAADAVREKMAKALALAAEALSASTQPRAGAHERERLWDEGDALDPNDLATVRAHNAAIEGCNKANGS